MHRRTAILLLVLAAGSRVPAAEAPSLDDIVAKHVEALGGIDNVRAIRSVRMSGRVTASGGRHALIVREIQKPGRVRTEFTYQGVTGVYAFDGERGWKVSPFDGSLDAEPMTEDEALQTSDQAEIEGPLVDWKAKGHQVALSGTETIEGRDVYELTVTLRSGRTTRLYLDARSFLPFRTESTRQIRGVSLSIETRLDDYRKIQGVLFPHAIEMGVVGRPRRMNVAVDEVEVNPTLPDERFVMPGPER
jgi:outer membrane lipoprotein-sorting protein